MCGIAGEYRPDRAADRSTVQAMLRTIVHRGPNASGVFCRGHAAIGQTRLSVIDLETGDPPITASDGSIGAVLNGEIYNFRHIRERLLGEGHRLSTSGDTEVLAHLAEDRSPVEIARELDGMFAFAIWDAKNERLVLGRDRFGKKPLYLWEGSAGQLVFGSELPTVLTHPSVLREMDHSALDAYLAFGYVPSPRTFYRSITSLPPGHVLVADCSGTTVTEYWRPPVPERDGGQRLDITFAEAVTECRRLLARAVEKRMISDVPLGAFLSGGVDSSAVAAFMAETSERPVKTFTIGFDDDHGFDERSHAEAVAKALKTEHMSFVVDPDCTEVLEDLVAHHGQPFGDSSALPVWYLSKLTSEHVTVALAGDGGDELFAGYERLAAASMLDRAQRRGGPLVRTAARQASKLPLSRVGARGAKLERFARRASLPAHQALLDWVSYVPREWRARLLPDLPHGDFDDFEAIWADSAGAPSLARVLDTNIRTYLLDDLLPKVDRVSMAHSLEVRSPLLDTDLAEFALRLPTRFQTRGMSLKRVLKAAVRGLVPDEIIDRPKHGFGLPLDRWFRTDLEPWVRSMLLDRPQIDALLDPPSIRALVEDHMRGTANHGHALWTLLTLEQWLRQ